MFFRLFGYSLYGDQAICHWKTCICRDL